MKRLRRLIGRIPGAGRVRRALGMSSKNEQYDQQTLAVMRRVLDRDSCCVDIGCHKGTMLAQMVRMSPQGRHLAFEAIPALAEDLTRNFPSATIHQVAVSDRVGTSEFLHVQNASAYSGLRRRVYDRPDPDIARLEVTTVTLDSVIAPDQSIDFVKLDIEGGEYHALLGAVETLQRCHPVVVFEAGEKSTGQYGVTPDELFALLTETLGYQLSTMARWLASSPELSRREFVDSWRTGSDYYFIAYC